MHLNEDEAGQVIATIRENLRRLEAADLLNSIDESRREGLVEALPDEKQKRPELKQVARTRKRPPTNREMLSIVVDSLNQRLVVLPAIASSVQQRLRDPNGGASSIVWRVDTEFVSAARIPEAKIAELLPAGMERVAETLTKIARLIDPQQVNK